jgi:hypothetical protein
MEPEGGEKIAHCEMDRMERVGGRILTISVVSARALFARSNLAAWREIATATKYVAYQQRSLALQ